MSRLTRRCVVGVWLHDHIMRAGIIASSAASDPHLVREYGVAEVEGRSVVDLALLQMQQAGVEIVQSYAWAKPSKIPVQ